MIDLTIRLPNDEAAALAQMARRFQFGDAQHLLRHSRSARPDRLCEAVTRLLTALTAAGGADESPEAETRAAVTFQVEKADLPVNRQFLETLLAAMPP
jgi:hypothetical protein